MNRMILLILALFAVVFSGPVTGQERLPDVEEWYLDSGMSLATITAQIKSSDRTQQFLALATLETQLRNGTVVEDLDAIVNVVSPALDQGVFTVSRNSNRPIEVYDPLVRAKAATILGELGTDSARARLEQSVLHDPEAIVQAQALLSIGRIGRDPDGRTTRVIARRMALEHYRASQFDPGVVDAGIQALRSLTANGSNTIDPAVREVLLEVAGDWRYSREIRTRALEILTAL